MILSVKKLKSTSRGLRVATILAAAMILPLGFGYAEKDKANTDKVVVKDKVVVIDKEAKKKNSADKELTRKKNYKNKEDNEHLKTWTLLKSKVDAGEMTMEEARKEMGEVKKEAAAAKAAAYQAKMKARIDKALEDGEITQEQADAKLARLEKAKQDKDSQEKANAKLESVWSVMQEKVKAGEMTEEEANKKMAAMKQQLKKGNGRGNQKVRSAVKSKRVENALTKIGVTEDQLDGTTKGMTRVVHAMQLKGEKFTVGEKMESYFSNDVGLSKEQIDQVISISERIAKATEKKTKRDQKENSGIGEIRAEPPKQVYRHNK